MSDCRFGVSPVNYPDPDPDTEHCHADDHYKAGLLKPHLTRADIKVIITGSDGMSF